jgi:hypothetical protein
VNGNVLLAAGSVVVLRRADWNALLDGALNVTVQPGAKLIVLPDEATVGDVLAAYAAASPPPAPSPTG